MSDATADKKPRSKRFYALVIGGVLLISCLCLGAVMSFGEDDDKTPTPTLTRTSTATQQPAATMTRTPRPTWTPKPTATKKPTEAPTRTLILPGIVDTIPPARPGCNCSVEYDCVAFGSQAEAQSCFAFCGGSVSYNWSALDGADGDGIVCESLP